MRARLRKKKAKQLALQRGRYLAFLGAAIEMAEKRTRFVSNFGKSFLRVAE